MTDPQQHERFTTGKGFIAALDQSGGSTPKALRLYGIEESAYANQAEMYDLIHAARTRVVTSPSFTSEFVLGAILFEATIDRQIDGEGVVDYLWKRKQIVPFLKIDQGLEPSNGGMQIMCPIPGLADLLHRAVEGGVYGTKERSVIHRADAEGIKRVVAQQFDLAETVLAAGLMPIVEPEVDITAPDKAQAEILLKAAVLARLDGLGDRAVTLKLTLPTVDDFYADLVAHPNVARVVALSGGYERAAANARLVRNHGVIASFSRALLDGLTAQQSDAEFDATLAATIASIYQASLT